MRLVYQDESVLESPSSSIIFVLAIVVSTLLFGPAAGRDRLVGQPSHSLSPT